MAYDFRASQIRTNKIIASGSTGTGAALILYGHENDGVPPLVGKIANTFNTGSIGLDTFLYVSGSENKRSVFGGGGYNYPGSTNLIDYVTTASTGNATYFGDLTVSRGYLAGCSSSTRGVFGGGWSSSVQSNVLDYITIASTGNATDFGDLPSACGFLAACSNAHGGL